MQLAMGLSGVILPLRIWDMMLPRVTIPITDLQKGNITEFTVVIAFELTQSKPQMTSYNK